MTDFVGRGLRNNNPGNIRLDPRGRNRTWVGLASRQLDKDFLQFATMAYGCRALLKTLRTYTHKHKLKTIRDIISRWAPPVENDTESYIAHVSQRMGFSPDEVLPLKDVDTYISLAKCIALHENGWEAQNIEDETWEVAVRLAGLPT